jgi:hypothetical protein
MIRHIARLLTIALFGVGIVACSSDDNPVCAAPLPAGVVGNPRPPAPRPAQQKPAQQRTTSKVQDKPRGPSGTTNGSGKKQDKPKAVTSNPAWKSGTKPTTWSGYNPNSRNWSTPYRKGYDPAPQPVIINNYGHDYRTYPGYIGYYPVGYWPMGYGAHYGCTAEREADPETTASPSPAPTVTVTAPASTTPSATPSPTPSGTP